MTQVPLSDPALAVDLTFDRPLLVLRLRGDLDILSTPEVCRLLNSALAGGATDVVVECAELAFVDGTAIRAIAHAADLVAARDGTLVLRDARPSLQRLFHAVGLDRGIRFDAPTPA